jgi:cysteine sulfinate desulfinase/cysteine desulfurase-like protein
LNFIYIIFNFRVYLDYNATTPLDTQVIEAINESLSSHWYNPSSQNAKGKQAKQAINESRKAIGDMINAPSSDVCFI